MNVLQVNIRLSQGGAGRVAWDLHKRLNATGTRSRFAYGYASGISDDAEAGNDASVIRLASRPTVLANYAGHRLVGRDWLTENKSRIRRLIAEADVVHLHAVHHYFLDTVWLLNILASQHKPTVITAHDWWYVSGRCGFTGSCRAWADACGKCAESGNTKELPSWLDFSATWRRARRRALAALAPSLEIVAPSQHILADYRSTLENISTRYIPNTFDLDFERMVSASSTEAAQPSKTEPPTIAVVAADLSYEPKTDPTFVRDVVKASGAKLVTLGKNSPFSGENVVNHGYVGERAKIAQIIRNAHYLLYSSTVDNAPLTIIESLVLGTPVVGRHAPATAELLAHIGARTVASASDAASAISGGWPNALYPVTADRTELVEAATRAFSPRSWVDAYEQVYRDAINRSHHPN